MYKDATAENDHFQFLLFRICFGFLFKLSRQEEPLKRKKRFLK
jgi:hypothetical protein